MDIAQVREAFDAQMRRRAGQATLEGVVRLVEEGPTGWAGVVWSAFEDTPDGGRRADRAIAAQSAWLRSPAGRGREFEWKLYDYDRPADLAERLTAAGFVPDAPETVMVAEVSELPRVPRPPDGVTLETVTDAAGVEKVVAVHEEAFGRDGTRLRARLLEQVGSPEVEITVALAGRRPVCGARTEFYPGTDFAGLWGGGTAPDWRGRGVYRALVAHRARLAAGRGLRWLQVDASDQSRPILERLGFAALGVTTPYLLAPEG